MKARGRIILVIMLVIAAALSFVSYQGIGEGKTLSAGNIKQGLDLSGGVYIVYEADKEDVTAEEMQAAVSLIQGRMDWNGWTEAEVAQEGTNRIRVDIPGVENAEEAIREIGQTAQLSFVDETGKVLLTGDMVADATKQVGAIKQGGNAEPYVALKFNDEGKQLFAEATAANIGKPIYIVMDGEVISAPMVQSAITTGEASITGSFTGESAEELASLIRAGSLPFNLNVIQMKNVGARLGADALATGVKAGAIGLALVLIFMLVVYKVLGFAADLALIIYVGLELILLNAFNITLTLPGIAGIILSVGMAVDANVVIFERLKEELVEGKTLRVAVKNGFSRALPAILDGNVTTLIAAVVLFFLGSGTVKGFATTLSMGIIISMFTALVVTRLIVNGLMQGGCSNPKYYGMRSK
ncbi:protein translocase subunit SecD [Anaerotignum lactatifermentans]|uniref:Protein translocase subunit SecD n=1 Tax=Anaerotignum lactatifermentans TaxID=160404 RepID=A0A1Y3UAZ8_9FIRM|nr:protein translocase subunit SecD [Anaerotignum lactatifermentans]OUN45265.1 protein translocase subunit SecD [Anaerotignum lactatifermentans]